VPGVRDATGQDPHGEHGELYLSRMSEAIAGCLRTSSQESMPYLSLYDGVLILVCLLRSHLGHPLLSPQVFRSLAQRPVREYSMSVVGPASQPRLPIKARPMPLSELCCAENIQFWVQVASSG
jgi:hypothetical protein